MLYIRIIELPGLLLITGIDRNRPTLPALSERKGECPGERDAAIENANLSLLSAFTFSPS